jgi:hypothetical protein
MFNTHSIFKLLTYINHLVKDQFPSIMVTKKKTLMHTLIGQNAGQNSSILNKFMPKGLVPSSNVVTVESRS